MSYEARDLLQLVELESIEQNIYRGRNRDIGTGRVFGGQVLAQALVAAQRTVEDTRVAHSLHGYFILPGDLERPIIYFVDRLRDGGSFTTRRVTAIQHGKAIFNLSASFHKQEPGFDHQFDPPDAPDPETLVPELERIREIADELPDKVRDVLTQDRPLDIRTADPVDLTDPVKRPARRRTWFRAIGEVPDDVVRHQALLAYASDYGLLATVLQPHGVTIRTPGMQVASLDHALWFHRPVRMDEWHLYVVDSPSAAGARGFARGSIYSRDGALVASVAQEGLIRMREDRPARSS